ncbi:MAG: hypothetical protein DMG35_08225 [Acidobacteria bacterium]|nr:MAG: hypothetical protein DMG35_08225 [Acidobacteriota bacterium]
MAHLRSKYQARLKTTEFLHSNPRTGARANAQVFFDYYVNDSGGYDVPGHPLKLQFFGTQRNEPGMRTCGRHPREDVS